MTEDLYADRRAQISPRVRLGLRSFGLFKPYPESGFIGWNIRK